MEVWLLVTSGRFGRHAWPIPELKGEGPAAASDAVGVAGGHDTSIGEDGGESLGGVVSIGELVGDVTHGYFFLAKSQVAN